MYAQTLVPLLDAICVKHKIFEVETNDIFQSREYEEGFGFRPKKYKRRFESDGFNSDMKYKSATPPVAKLLTKSLVTKNKNYASNILTL